MPSLMTNLGLKRFLWTCAAMVMAWSEGRAATPDLWGWQTAMAVTPNKARSSQYDIALDSIGNAVVVWSQVDSSSVHVFASYRSRHGEWETPQRIDVDSFKATSPKVAVDGEGNFMVTWSQGVKNTRITAPGFGANRLWNFSAIAAARRVVGQGWEKPTIVYSDTNRITSAVDPMVVMDRVGNARIAWRMNDLNTDENGSWISNRVMAARYSKDSGFGEAKFLIDSPDDCDGLSLAMDRNGNAMIVWIDAWGVSVSTCSRFADCNEMQAIETAPADKLVGGGVARVGYDDSGNAMVAWLRPGSSEFRSRGFRPGAGWDSVVVVQDSTHAQAWKLDLAVGSSGDAIVLWCPIPGPLQASYFRKGDGWGKLKVLDSTLNQSGPKTAFDGHGGAVAIWMHVEDGKVDIWSNRYVPGADWADLSSSGIVVNSHRDSIWYPPVMATDRSGGATAVWIQQGRLFSSDLETNSASNVIRSGLKSGVGLQGSGRSLRFQLRIPTSVFLELASPDGRRKTMMSRQILSSGSHVVHLAGQGVPKGAYVLTGWIGETRIATPVLITD